MEQPVRFRGGEVAGEAARKAAIAVFTALGTRSPLSDDSHRKLALLL